MSTKVRLVKAMVFPVVIFGCESWTVRKVECRRIDAYELRHWRRLLRVPWTASRSFLGVHWKDWCWSWSSNTLATWGEELTHWKRPWCWERLRAGGEGDGRGWDDWMASLTQWTWVWVDSGSQRVRHDWATELKSVVSPCVQKLEGAALHISMSTPPLSLPSPCPLAVCAQFLAISGLPNSSFCVNSLWLKFPLPAFSSENYFHEVSWHKYRVHFICFPFLKNHVACLQHLNITVLYLFARVFFLMFVLFFIMGENFLSR